MNRNARHRRRRQTMRQLHRELQRAAWDVARAHGRFPYTHNDAPPRESWRQATLDRLVALLPARRPR